MDCIIQVNIYTQVGLLLIADATMIKAKRPMKALKGVYGLEPRPKAGAGSNK